jgi:phospholipid/cholesterol/gamma-HCH transport system substrate-binding protein
MSYNKMKVAVGIFVLLFFVSIAGFGYMLLDAKGFFEKQRNYFFLTDSASSLTIGMPVKFSGLAIGSIENIELLDDGHVKAEFFVDEKNAKWINRYTYLLLKKPLLGSPHIEVLAASGNPPLKPGSKLPLIVTDDINDLVTKFEPVVDKLLHIIENVETITKSMADSNSSLNVTMKNLEIFSSKLAHDDSLITTITGDEKAARNINDSIEKLNAMLSDLTHISHNLHRDLIEPTSASLKEFHAILLDVHTKLQTLQPLIKQLGSSDKDIAALQESIQTTIQKSNQLMEKIDTILTDTDKEGVKLP